MERSPLPTKTNWKADDSAPLGHFVPMSSNGVVRQESDYTRLPYLPSNSYTDMVHIAIGYFELPAHSYSIKFTGHLVFIIRTCGWACAGVE